MPNPEELNPHTQAIAAFAAWLAEHPELTGPDLNDIAAQLRDLRGEIPLENLTPKTTGGVAFKRWVILAPINAQAIKQDPNNWLNRLKELPNPPEPEIIKKIKTIAAQIKKIETLPSPAPTPPRAPTPPTPAPELIIHTTPYPKWWKTLNTAAISLSTAGTQLVVPLSGRFTLFIATIVLTVSDETNISFGFGVFGSSGSLDLGGSDEPRGIVIAMGDSPAPCGQGGFSVSSSGEDAAVGGFVTYYLEKET
jgi:hypothetical protein